MFRKKATEKAKILFSSCLSNYARRQSSEIIQFLLPRAAEIQHLPIQYFNSWTDLDKSFALLGSEQHLDEAIVLIEQRFKTRRKFRVAESLNL